VKSRGLRLLPLVVAVTVTAQTPSATPPADPDDLYKLGKQLFDELATPEIKAQFEFPSKAQWDEFAARLQRALEGDDLSALAAYEPEARAALATEIARARCATLAEDLEALANWSAEGFKSVLQKFGATHGVRGRELFQPVRAALTGRTHGPELPLIAAALGGGTCVARLRAASRGESGSGGSA
jgi:glutamyl/glutaminyl-tRNA synthetase